ncbi:MAG: DNA polymerase IV [Actinobacteria bacterium]|nr:DNA polymerase IV [Actinomycetota bacterium]
MASTVIIHVDMDAFFASVEQRDNPALQGMPLAVGGKAEERGVIATASYEARRYGIRSAMPTATALRLCPGLVLVPPDHKKYALVSEKLMDILRRYTPVIEPVSLDEAFMDVTGSLKLFGGAEAIGKMVQADIKSALSLTASVGVGPNKFIAKLASDWKKPEGLTVVGDVEGFLAGLAISSLWGVGPQTVEKLEKIGIKTVTDLKGLSCRYLAGQFGVAGERLYQMARGIDPRPVTPERKAKSVGREITFPSDIVDRQVLLDNLLDMSDYICRVLRRQGMVCQGVTLKIKYPDLKTVTRATALSGHTSDGIRVYKAAEELLDRNWSGVVPVRLIGVSTSRLADRETLPAALFPDREKDRSKKLNSAVDGLLDRFGENALVRGRLVGRGSRRRGNKGKE